MARRNSQKRLTGACVRTSTIKHLNITLNRGQVPLVSHSIVYYIPSLKTDALRTGSEWMGIDASRHARCVFKSACQAGAPVAGSVCLRA